jgi:hypothetical protein
MRRLIEWFRLRAATLRKQAFRSSTRAVTTVECQECTLIVGPLRAGSLDPGTLQACPLCGSKLCPEMDGPIHPGQQDHDLSAPAERPSARNRWLK